MISEKSKSTRYWSLKSLFDRNVLYSLYFIFPEYVSIGSNKYKMCCTLYLQADVLRKCWSLWTIREGYFITAIADLWLFTLWTFLRVIHNYRSWILKGLFEWFIDPLINTFKETGMYVYAYIIREVNFRTTLYLFLYYAHLV